MTATSRRLRPTFVLIAMICALAGAVAARQADGVDAGMPGQAPPSQTAAFFEARIRPILVAHCFDCHADDEKGDLRVDSREALLTGGASGPAIVPGKPDDSLLIKVVRQVPGVPKMPKGRAALKADDIDTLATWIREGAAWPSSTEAAAKPTASHAMTITAEDRAFWSIRPLQTPAVPRVRNAAWPKTDIDRFILARLETEGLAPVADADKLTLIRRATLDLTGVPPTPEEVDAFLADRSATAFAKVVDRLLASPRYGETWGRLWLDVARYGEDDYRSLDPQGRGLNPYPNAYLYRDWVIKAFNDDLAYDQFVKAQLAADQMDPAVRVRMLPALGFLGLGPYYYDNGAVEITKADERHDRVDAVSRGFLGLTVGCARCHDHKYDPIAAADYYALAGVFGSTGVSRVSARAESRGGRIQDPEEEDRKERGLARRVSSGRIAAARRNARVPGHEIHGGRVARDWRTQGREGRRHRVGEARLRAVRSLGPVPGEAARVLPVPQTVAGDGEGRRHRSGGQEARG